MRRNRAFAFATVLYVAGALALTVACILLYKHPSSRRGLTILCGSAAMTIAAGALREVLHAGWPHGLAGGMLYGLVLAYLHVVVLVVTVLHLAHLKRNENETDKNGETLGERVVDHSREAGTLHTDESWRSKLNER